MSSRCGAAGDARGPVRPAASLIPAQIELASEQIMLGGRPLQDISAELQSDAKSWMVRRLEFRAPGSTRCLDERRQRAGRSRRTASRPRSTSESSDPDALMTWLQGRGEVAYRSQKPLRLRGDVTVSPAGFAIDAMKAEIEGGTVEGRVAVAHREATSGSKVEAQLKAERLDLDATASSSVRSPARKPNGLTRRSCRSISGVRSPRGRNCGRCRRSSPIARGASCSSA